MVDDADTHLGPMRAAARQPVLLGHSYYLRYDEKQARKMKPYPPLATLIAASVVRGRGFRMLVLRDRPTWFHMAACAKIHCMSGDAKVSVSFDRTCAGKCGPLEEE